MRGKVLIDIRLPASRADTIQFRTYKIMPRAQNAHAYVNAGFLIGLDGEGIVQAASICYGGIEPRFTHASATEHAIRGMRFHCDGTLQVVMRLLRSELQTADWVLPDASPEYRIQLAQSLYYRFVLATAPPAVYVAPRYVSGGAAPLRGLSSGRQEFDTVRDNYPLTEALPKYDGLIQCAGEAEYVNDLPPFPGELWAAFVPATQVNAIVGEIDGTEVLVSLICAFPLVASIGNSLFIYRKFPASIASSPPPTFPVPTISTPARKSNKFCSDAVHQFSITASQSLSS